MSGAVVIGPGSRFAFDGEVVEVTGFEGARVTLRDGRDRWRTLGLAGFLARACVRCAQVPGTVATRTFVRRAHALGLDVHVWTINDRAEMIRYLDLGANGIMTDEIETLRDVLIERGQWHPRVGSATP